MPAGRPTDYTKDYNEQAYKLCLLGATDKELADFFEVSESTLNLWKTEHPEFSESMRRGKSIADAEVADRLYQRAKGYTHEAVKIMQANGEPLIVPYTEHYAPDTAAASLWLRNRQPEKWRDKVDHELTGKDGKDLIPEGSVTDLDVARRLAFILERGLRGAST